MGIQAKDGGSGGDQGDTNRPKTGMGIELPAKAGSNPGQGDNQAPKTGMGIDVRQAHALLIGIGRCDEAQWSLPVSATDARQFAKVLADPQLCAYPKGHIRVLTDETATRGAILEALDHLAREVGAGEGTTVLVYYSGHGWRQATGTQERYFLIPHDVDAENIPGSALAAEDFIAALRRIRSERLVVIIDTCHASAMAEAKGAVLPAPFISQILPESLLDIGQGRVAMLSCRHDEKSWILPGEGSLSIFTHYLLAGLKEAGWSQGADSQRTVTISDLMGYLSRNVPRAANTLGKVQNPFFKVEAQDFAVALDRGGKGTPQPTIAASPEFEKPIQAASVYIAAMNAGRDNIVAGTIGSLVTGASTGKG